MKREECALFARTVMETQQRLLRNNPVVLPVEALEQVYTELY